MKQGSLTCVVMYWCKMSACSSYLCDAEGLPSSSKHSLQHRLAVLGVLLQLTESLRKLQNRTGEGHLALSTPFAAPKHTGVPAPAPPAQNHPALTHLRMQGFAVASQPLQHRRPERQHSTLLAAQVHSRCGLQGEERTQAAQGGGGVCMGLSGCGQPTSTAATIIGLASTHKRCAHQHTGWVGGKCGVSDQQVQAGEGVTKQRFHLQPGVVVRGATMRECWGWQAPWQTTRRWLSRSYLLWALHIAPQAVSEQLPAVHGCTDTREKMK